LGLGERKKEKIAEIAQHGAKQTVYTPQEIFFKVIKWKRMECTRHGARLGGGEGTFTQDFDRKN
jgi:hypothetical protein